MVSNNRKNKKERRLVRHIRNVKKEIDQKREDWEKGKLLKENHNGGPYSAPYSLEVAQRIYERLQVAWTLAKTCSEDNIYLIKNGGSRNQMFIDFFRRYRIKIRDLILHWNPEAPKNDKYWYLRRTIETYWDNSDHLIDNNYPILEHIDYGCPSPGDRGNIIEDLQNKRERLYGKK